MSDSVTPWTIVSQAPLVHGIHQAKILEWVAIPFSRESSQSGDQNQDLLHCKQILYYLSHQGSPSHALATLDFSAFPMVTSEKAMAPHSSTLAWKIPWTEKPGRLQSMGSRRVGHD